jgi:hypothetical protein
MKILAIGPDAASLESSCGVTLEKFAREGNQVSIITIRDPIPSKSPREGDQVSANKATSRNDETLRRGISSVQSRKSFEKRGIHILSLVSDFDCSTITQRNGDLLSEQVSKVGPDMVIVPSLKSNDETARVLSRSALIACRGIGSILMYGDRVERDSNQFSPHVTFQFTSMLAEHTAARKRTAEQSSVPERTTSSSTVEGSRKDVHPATVDAPDSESFESHRLLLLQDEASRWL